MKLVCRTLIALCFSVGLVTSMVMAGQINKIMGSAVDATGAVVPLVCTAFNFEGRDAVTVPSSVAFSPLSLSVVPTENLWAATYALIAGGSSAQVVVGTLAPFGITGTSVTVSAGGISNEMRVIVDENRDIHLINSANAAGPCGFTCFQYYLVTTGGVLSTAINTPNPANVSTGISGISQDVNDVFISTTFGAAGGGHATVKFAKNTGVLASANGAENSVSSANRPLIVDEANNIIYSGHSSSASSIKQFARYSISPFTFLNYVSAAGIGFSYGGMALNNADNTLLLMSSEGTTTTTHRGPRTGLVPLTNVVISAIAGNNATQNVVYDAIDNKLFVMTAIREVILKHGTTLATEATYVDTNSVSPLENNVVNGLHIDTSTLTMYYLRKNVSTSLLQLVQLGYCVS